MKIMIGIDTGKKTGFAVAFDKKNGKGGEIQKVSTLSITEAMRRILLCADKWGKENIKIYIEDPRKRKWFGDMDRRQELSGAGVREGVGSVKRDASIWEDWCEEEGLQYELIHPAANITKYKDSTFKKVTGYTERTSVHGRDAAMLVFGRYAKF